MCSCDDAERPDFFEQAEAKARKEHRCCECPFPIEKGERYVCSRGKWDGEVKTYRRHKACDEAAEDLSTEPHCSMPFGELRSDLTECGPDRGSRARQIWGRHLWRFRRHPKARDCRLSDALEFCENFVGGKWVDVPPRRQAPWEASAT